MRVQVTLGDFRRKTADLPDDTAIFIEMENCYDWHEVSETSMKFLPASLDAPPALLLGGGQQFDEEHYIGPRFDVFLDYGHIDGGLKP
jgi:hypothetical protein